MAIPKFVEVRGDEWIATVKDANRYRKLKKLIHLPHPHKYRLTVQDYRSPPISNLDMELDAIPDVAADDTAKE